MTPATWNIVLGLSVAWLIGVCIWIHVRNSREIARLESERDARCAACQHARRPRERRWEQ